MKKKEFSTHRVFSWSNLIRRRRVPSPSVPDSKCSMDCQTRFADLSDPLFVALTRLERLIRGLNLTKVRSSAGKSQPSGVVLARILARYSLLSRPFDRFPTAARRCLGARCQRDWHCPADSYVCYSLFLFFFSLLVKHEESWLVYIELLTSSVRSPKFFSFIIGQEKQ